MELDPSDDAMILDWLTEHPTTMSEASGRGVKDWAFFLTPGYKKELKGLEYLGTSPQLTYRYVQPETSHSTFFHEFLNERSSMLSTIPPVDLDVVTSEFVPPSEADLYAHISGFGVQGGDGTHLSAVTYAGLLAELRDVERWGSPLTNWLNPLHLSKIKVPTKTSPGIRWKKMGYKTKKDALMPAIYEAAKNVNRMIETREGYVVPPCGVAGRGKRADANRLADIERKEGRLIVMPDLVRHLIGSLGSSPYMGALRDVDKTNGGVLLGMGPFSDSYSNIAKWCEGAESFMFIDFSKFDQSIPRTVLSHVMKHIASRFEKTSGSAAYWESEFRHLVDTEIAMPRGDVYRKSRGVASGDPWTSLADSYSNWLVLKHACNRLKLKVKIWTFGDDSVVAIYNKKVTSADLEEVATLSKSNFGMTVSKKKSYVSEHLVDIDDDPEPGKSGSFLSMCFLATEMGIRPTRGIQDLYELMMVPERNRKDKGWEVVRTSMAYLVFYYNTNARYLLEEYWDYLHEKYKIPELTGTSEDLSMLREMDVPWSAFKWEWLNRLPRPGEVELLYKYGHTGFFSPLLWGVWYSRYDDDIFGNSLSLSASDHKKWRELRDMG